MTVKRAKLSKKLVQELMELTEITNPSEAIDKAVSFYLECQKLKKDGYVLIAAPSKIGKSGMFEPDNKKLKDYKIIYDN